MIDTIVSITNENEDISISVFLAREGKVREGDSFTLLPVEIKDVDLKGVRDIHIQKVD